MPSMSPEPLELSTMASLTEPSGAMDSRNRTKARRARARSSALSGGTEWRAPIAWPGS